MIKNNNSIDSFTREHAFVGKRTAWLVASLITIYLVTLILGMISLDTPEDQIGNPYFTILELLIIILGPLMVTTIGVVHMYASSQQKIYSLLALVFISIATLITCSLHFAILTLSRQPAFADLDWTPLLFSFNWPSVAYALDILAWDVFFALSMLFASAVFRERGLERVVRFFLITSGVISLIGIIGIPLNNMQIRNLGIAGYTAFAIVVFFLLGLAFSRRMVKKETGKHLLNSSS
jgi:hypothetical protein